MHWSEEGVVLGVRRQGEANVVLELFTRDHGRHLGLVRGGRGRRLRPVLQTGNLIAAHWRARLPEHLGSFTVEALEMNAARLMDQCICLGTHPMFVENTKPSVTDIRQKFPFSECD